MRQSIIVPGPAARRLQETGKCVVVQVVKPQPPPRLDGSEHIYQYGDGWRYSDCEYQGEAVEYAPIKPGQVVRVREDAYIAPVNFGDNCNMVDDQGNPRIVGWSASMDSEAVRCARDYGVKETPAQRTPLWACRSGARVEVRCARLQEITEEECIAAGVNVSHYYCDEGTDDDPTPAHRCDPKGEFREYWDSTRRAGERWEWNPFCWFCTLTREEE